jgi:hypothetical protein
LRLKSLRHSIASPPQQASADSGEQHWMLLY